MRELGEQGEAERVPLDATRMREKAFVSETERRDDISLRQRQCRSVFSASTM